MYAEADRSLECIPDLTSTRNPTVACKARMETLSVLNTNDDWLLHCITHVLGHGSRIRQHMLSPYHSASRYNYTRRYNVMCSETGRWT
ncbi:hypothetical protein EV356DRAFT_246933 [Viridothelium virens]|uniref:Uncharacterized protein n=1 Tax=Viridothelium virens TaxID=1048519 RepID=A0A6A6H3D4_VIRVR|nr:hypothetical protein EV356DRAFT_246933 [Viridothelium virens]